MRTSRNISANDMKTNDKQPNHEFEPWFTTLAELDGIYCYYWIRVLSTVDGEMTGRTGYRAARHI